jgi:hypothetical protein
MVGIRRNTLLTPPIIGYEDVRLKNLRTPCSAEDYSAPLQRRGIQPITLAPVLPVVPVRIIRSGKRSLVIDWLEWMRITELRRSGMDQDTLIPCVILDMKLSAAKDAYKGFEFQALISVAYHPRRVAAQWIRHNPKRARGLGVSIRDVERSAGLSSGSLARRK